MLASNEALQCEQGIPWMQVLNFLFAIHSLHPWIFLPVQSALAWLDYHRQRYCIQGRGVSLALQAMLRRS